MQDFRKLEVWKASRRLTLGVYRATRGFPQEEKFGLRSQLRRAAVSIAANIAEGCGRGGRAELRHFLQIAAGSASEVECELVLALDLEFLTAAQVAVLGTQATEIRRMLTGLGQSIGRQVKSIQ